MGRLGGINKGEARMWFRAPLYLALLLFSARLAHADSCILPSAPRFQLKSDTVEWKMQIVSGRSCIRGLSYGPAIVDAVKLVSPPQTGQVKLFGPGFEYLAKSNFSGEDTFTLQVSGAIIRSRGTSDIKVTVSVGEK
jgi:hypothetical protein